MPSRSRPPGSCWGRPSPACCGSARSTSSWSPWPSSGSPAPGSLFGNLYFVRRWGLDTAQRSEVYSIIGLAAFLGLPVAYVLGDRMFRRAPERPLVIAGICISVYGVLFVTSLYMPKLWMVVALQFLATAAISRWPSASS